MACRRRCSWARRCGSHSARSGADGLGGGGGGGGAEVGGKIGDGEVDLVTNTGDHRDGATADGAGDGFVIESPEVLAAAAAPGDDQDILAAAPGHPCQGREDLRHGLVALHRYRIEKDW